MENFWDGFEKQAILQAAARGLGRLTGALSRHGSSAASAVKSVPAKIKAVPGQMRDAYVKGRVEAVKGVAKPLANPAAVRSAPQASNVVKGVQDAAAATPKAVGGFRSHGKAMIGGGLVGAGGVYMANSGGAPENRAY